MSISLSFSVYIGGLKKPHLFKTSEQNVQEEYHFSIQMNLSEEFLEMRPVAALE